MYASLLPETCQSYEQEGSITQREVCVCVCVCVLCVCVVCVCCVCVCVSHMIIGKTERCRGDWTVGEQTNGTKKFIEWGA